MSKISKSNLAIQKHLDEQQAKEYLKFKHEQRLSIYMHNPLVYFRRLQHTHENPKRAQVELSAQEHQAIRFYINSAFSHKYLRKLIEENHITVLTGS